MHQHQAIYSTAAPAGWQRAVCDKFGLKLASLNLDGRFNRFHDEVKFAIAHSLGTLGVGYSAEVHGVFTPVIPPAAQTDARRFMQRGREGAQRGQRQGLVPDFKIELERLVDSRRRRPHSRNSRCSTPDARRRIRSAAARTARAATALTVSSRAIAAPCTRAPGRSRASAS